MGQEQYKTGGSEGQRQEKIATPDKDRANARIGPKLGNNPATSWKDSKPAPLSKPV